MPTVLASTADASRYAFLPSLRGFDQNGDRIVMARPTLREHSPRGFPSLESTARPSTRELSLSLPCHGESSSDSISLFLLLRFVLSGSVIKLLLDNQAPRVVGREASLGSLGGGFTTSPLLLSADGRTTSGYVWVGVAVCFGQRPVPSTQDWLSQAKE